jgi:hypothetical protein
VISRPILHVSGPPGSGKTTFIEAVLRSLHSDVTCIRATRDGSLRRPQERRPKSHEESRRYRAAGATGVAVYSFPSAHADPDTFYMTDFMAGYSTAVIIEGDCPLEYVELTAFVAPAPSPGSSLLHRVLRHHEAEHAESLAAMERVLESPQSLARFLLGGVSKEALKYALANPGTLEKSREEMKASLEKRRAAPAPPPTEHWAVASPYEGIEQAQLVVVNARSDDERKRGTDLVQETARMREDDAVFHDLFDIQGSRVPITAVIADLRGEKDPGLKKALARVKRALRDSD